MVALLSKLLFLGSIVNSNVHNVFVVFTCTCTLSTSQNAVLTAVLLVQHLADNLRLPVEEVLLALDEYNTKSPESSTAAPLDAKRSGSKESGVDTTSPAELSGVSDVSDVSNVSNVSDVSNVSGVSDVSDVSPSTAPGVPSSESLLLLSRSVSGSAIARPIVVVTKKRSVPTSMTYRHDTKTGGFVLPLFVERG